MYRVPQLLQSNSFTCYALMIYFAILFVCFRDTLATHVMLTSNSLCNNNVEKISFPQCVITGAESQVSDYQVGQWTAQWMIVMTLY